MKRFLKIIPFLLCAVAIVMALNTNAMGRNKKALMLVQGYIRGGPGGTICQASIWCSDIGNQLCMVGTTQVWGKHANGLCILEVYKAPE